MASDCRVLHISDCANVSQWMINPQISSKCFFLAQNGICFSSLAEYQTKPNKMHSSDHQIKRTSFYQILRKITILQVIAAEGEQKASKALKEASDIISESPAALQLRYLQTLSTISSEKNSTIVFPIPIELMAQFRGWSTRVSEQALKWNYN